MASAADIGFMQQALDLAAKGRGRTHPNPMVGAVIVKSGQIIGRGYHRVAGGDHAEVAAIKNARGNARDATMYVTLEPCCHHGKTGPCSEAVKKAGIKRLVYAVRDPNPDVNGGGARCLKRAGVEVLGGVLKKEARRLNEVYFGVRENKRPFITLKMAQTLDGRIATRTGDSKWISGKATLKIAHRLRVDSEAVLVGMGTVRADNPSLTVRLVKGKNPYRVIVSRSLKFRRACQLIDNNDDFKTIIATTTEEAERFSRSRKGKHLIYWTVGLDKNGMLDVRDIVARAGEFGMQSMLIEGGSGLVTSFLKQGLFDKYVAVTAPIVLGSGIDSIGDLGIKRLAHGIRFGEHSFESHGDDIVFVGYPKKDGK